MELLDIADEYGNLTGEVMDREKVHDLNLLHWEIAVFIINDKKQTKIIIPCSYTDKMGDIFDKLWSKYGEKDSTAKFVHNAKNISPSLTVSESGLTNNTVIQVMLLRYIEGAN